MTLKPGLGVTPGHRNRYRSATCDFLLTFYIATIGLSRTVSEINADFSRKSQIFPPRVFCAPAEWVPLELRTGARGQKKLEWWGYLTEKEIWRYLQASGYNQPKWHTNRQTDGRTDTGRQQRPRLRIASHGKKDCHDSNYQIQVIQWKIALSWFCRVYGFCT